MHQVQTYKNRNYQVVISDLCVWRDSVNKPRSYDIAWYKSEAEAVAEYKARVSRIKRHITDKDICA